MGNAYCSAAEYRLRRTTTGQEATINASKVQVNVPRGILTSIAFKNLDNARIVKLNLSCNQHTLLPVEIGMMTGLKELYLYDNQLTCPRCRWRLGC